MSTSREDKLYVDAIKILVAQKASEDGKTLKNIYYLPPTDGYRGYFRV